MERIAQFIKENMGVVIIFVIAAVGVTFFFIGNGLSPDLKDKANKNVATASDMEYERYNNTTVPGIDVIQAAKDYKDKPQFSVLIKNAGSTTAFYAQNTSATTVPAYVAPSTGTTLADPGTVSSSAMVTADQMKDATDLVHYVNPTADFSAKVYRAKDGKVRLITFTQK